jgi:hypothetical protein
MVMVRRHMDGIREFGASVIEKIKSFLNWLKTHAGKGARILIKALLRLIQAASACLAIKAGKDYKAAVSGMGSEDYKAEVEKARAKFIRAKRMVEKVGWDYINSGANNANIIGENYRSSKKRLEELENGKDRAKSALGLKLIISLSSALAAQLGIAAVNARKDSMAYLRRYRRNDGPITYLKQKANALIEKIRKIIQGLKEEYPTLMRINALLAKISVILSSGLLAYKWKLFIESVLKLKKDVREVINEFDNVNREPEYEQARKAFKEGLEGSFRQQVLRGILKSLLSTLVVVLTGIVRWKVANKLDPDWA